MFRTAERSAFSKGVFRDADPQEGGLFRAEEPPAGGMERYHVSAVDDPEEVSAERTADQVMGGGIFREADGPGAEGGMGLEGGEAELPSADLAGPGSALPAGLQASMGAAMGADFSSVRVHTGAGADRANRSLSSRAFTRGQDVYFREGEYDPASREGQHLIAHELAHVADGTEGLHRLFGWRSRRQAGNANTPAAGQNTQTSGQNTPASGTGGGTTSPAEDPTSKGLLDRLNSNVPTIITESDSSKAVLEELKKKPKDVIKDNDNVAKLNGAKASLDALKTNIKGLLSAIKGQLDRESGPTDAQKNDLEAFQTNLDKMLKDTIDPLLKECGDLQSAVSEETDNASMSDSVKDMMNSPYFDAFRQAVGDLKKGQETAPAGASEKRKAHIQKKNQQAEAEAGEGYAKARRSKMSAEDKRKFIQQQDSQRQASQQQASQQQASQQQASQQQGSQQQGNRLDGLNKVKDPSKGWGKAGTALSIIGSGTGELSDDIGATRKADLINKGKTDDTADNSADKASGAVKAAGQGLEAIGAGLSALQNGLDAKEQREKEKKAKLGLKMMAKRLRSTLPTIEPTEVRATRIKAVCDWVEEGGQNTDRESLDSLILSAMDNDTGLDPLTEKQKTLLSGMLAMEKSRAAREKKAGALKKEGLFNLASLLASALKALGSGFSAGSGGGLLGAGLSLAGKGLEVMLGKGREMAQEVFGAGANEEEEDENENKLAASRTAIQMMMKLPEITDEQATALKDKAKDNDKPVNGGTMAAAEQYAEAFYTIESSNVNMSDILFAIEKGGFGAELEDKGGGQMVKKSYAASMRDMYKNLSFS